MKLPKEITRFYKVAFFLESGAVLLNLFVTFFTGLSVALVWFYFSLSRDTRYSGLQFAVSDVVSTLTFAFAVTGLILVHIALSKNNVKNTDLIFAILTLVIGYLHVIAFIVRAILTFWAIANRYYS